jgi:ribosomal protein L11 methyltransferase
MTWLALELEIEGAAAEPLSDALLELGADSVAIEEAGAPGRWERNRIRVLVSPHTDAAAFVRTAAAAAGLPDAPPFEIRRVEPQDWVRRSQSQFGPLGIGERLWIVPSWAEPPSHEKAVVLRLDPGLAFGTGSHPTTRLVLVWLEQQLAARSAARAPGSVLDYGCGSGILALAAAKFGAAHVAATDNDAQALATCAENAAGNGLSLEVLPPERLGARRFDLLVANILARPLIELAPRLAALAAERASLALSGILEDQVDEVLGAYAASFDLAVAGRDEGWALLAGMRR